MKTFLFYDIETSGLNPAFDQVLTFAYIRTDLNLKEIDRQTITICLRKDIVPSPEAFITHGLTWQELENGISEYKAALKIHKIFNTAGTISVGYNSLGFDDEFLRFLFYRNLLDPYEHQYRNGCSRMDILPVTTVFKVFYPEALKKWPVMEGRSSLKLELISRENQFVTSGRAHEAMSDVEALLALSCQLSRKKDIWQYTLDFFNKTRDEVRVKSFDTHLCVEDEKFLYGVMVSPSFGPDNNYLAPVIHIGQSDVYKNQELWLRLDSEDILGLEGKVDIEDTFVVRKRFGDIPVVLPALARFLDKIPTDIRDRVNVNIDKINSSYKRFSEFTRYHCAFKYPFVPDMDLDAALYQDGFFSGAEKKQSLLFHQASFEQKKDVLSQITSNRIKQLAQRILLRNFQEIIHDDGEYGFEYCLKQTGYDIGSEDSIIGYKNDVKLSRTEAMAKLKELEVRIDNPDYDQQKMLEWLNKYLQEL